jgi:hypothetical protein
LCLFVSGCVLCLVSCVSGWANLFSILRIHARVAGLEAKVSDVVIGVPSYWNDVQRFEKRE